MFLDFSGSYINGGMICDENEREIFDLANVDSINFISNVKLAYNFKCNVVKIGFSDKSFEYFVISKEDYIYIADFKIDSPKAYKEFYEFCKDRGF